jgi:transposase
MKAIPNTTAIYVWQGSVDMRMSFDRLSLIVQEQLGRSVFGGGVYVFFSRCRSRVKLLYWDRDGYALWHKRLEAGSYEVARVDESEEITAIDLEEILSGISFSRIKLRKNVEKGSYSL